MPLLNGLDFSIDVSRVLRAQGADPAAVQSRRPKLAEIAGRALRDGLPLLKSKVTYREVEVRSTGNDKVLFSAGSVLSGRFITKHLARAKKAVIILCTIGKELEQRISKLIAESMIDGLALDGVGSAAVEALGNAVCRHFEDQAAKAGMHSTIPYNPGMVDWPVETGQPEIFNLLDAERIGVSLTSSFMMIPCKSLSMVIGMGHDLHHGERSCDYCSMQKTCAYQEHYV